MIFKWLRNFNALHDIVQKLLKNMKYNIHRLFLAYHRLVDLHDQYGCGATYSDPTVKVWKHIVCIVSFIDNCNLYNTGEKYETIRYILRRTHNDAKLLNSVVCNSGAKLELLKCFTQIICFEFSLRWCSCCWMA